MTVNRLHACIFGGHLVWNDPVAGAGEFGRSKAEAVVGEPVCGGGESASATTSVKSACGRAGET